MKILMPYKSRGGIAFDATVVNGGLEKFAKQLYSLIPGIIPVVITDEDRVERRTKQIIKKAIEKHKPDMAITNDIDYTCSGYFQEFGIPLISIVHEGLIRDVRYLELGYRLNKIQELGGHVYFVSQPQFNFHASLSMRARNVKLCEPTGYIPSSFIDSDMPFADEITYDIGTVGRQAPDKDPFWVHRKLEKTDYSTCVVTVKHHAAAGSSYSEYAEKTNEWFDREYPRVTFESLPHDEVLRKISSFGVYTSTCPYESWGITALEALGCGVPLMLLTDSSGTHSSEGIVALPNHYVKSKKGASVVELKEKYDSLLKLTLQERKDIAYLTAVKHSKENYQKLLNNIIQKRLDDKIKSIYTGTDLTQFF